MAQAERTGVVAQVEHASVLESLTPHIFQTLLREPALAITLGYLFVALAGIFYNYTFYQRFGVPVLTLSQVGDFLVAGIQQPMAILLVATTFPIVWLIDRFNHHRRRRRSARRQALLAASNPSRFVRARAWVLQSPPRWVTVLALVMVVFIYGWMFVQTYARYRAADAENGNAPMVTVWLAGQSEPLPSQSKAWTYLGAVSNYVFVFDHDARRAQILPVNNIARLQPANVPVSSHGYGILIAPIP